MSIEATGKPEKTPETSSQATLKAEDRLLLRLHHLIEPLGYELVHLEVQSHRNKTLRLFIDKIDRPTDDSIGGIGIEDCAIVSKTLDEPLESVEEINEIFKGAAYELEVSSPGVDRPLRREQDFQRFAGRRVRVNTFRPLSGEELENSTYSAQNPKQKNFLGELLGLDTGKMILRSAIGNAEVRIPLNLVAKANLDPDFDFSETSKNKTNRSKRKEN